MYRLTNVFANYHDGELTITSAPKCGMTVVDGKDLFESIGGGYGAVTCMGYLVRDDAIVIFESPTKNKNGTLSTLAIDVNETRTGKMTWSAYEWHSSFAPGVEEPIICRSGTGFFTPLDSTESTAEG